MSRWASTICSFIVLLHLGVAQRSSSDFGGPLLGLNASFGSYLTHCTSTSVIYLAWSEYDCAGNHTTALTFPLDSCARQNGGDGDSSYTASCGVSSKGLNVTGIDNYFGTTCSGQAFLSWDLPTDQCVNWDQDHPIGTLPESQGTETASEEEGGHQGLFTLHPKATAPVGWEEDKTLPFIDLNSLIPIFIGLKRNNMEHLESIVKRVSDPHSSEYGEHLSSNEVKSIVSPGSEALDRVFSWLEESIHVKRSAVTLAAHEDSLKLNLTRSQVATLLGVSWRSYRQTARAGANSAVVVVKALDAVRIPSTLSDVVEVIAGHRSWPILASDKTRFSHRPYASVANITPDILWSTYGMNSSLIPKPPSGVRNVQAFVQIGPDSYSQEDLSQFCKTYLPPDFPNCTIARSVGGKDGTNYGDESQLDSQYLLTMGYGSETWVYTEPNLDFCHDLMSWSQDVFGLENATHPNTISFSAGDQCRPNYCQREGAHRLNGDTMKMAAIGISVFFASGDLGSGQFCRSHWNGGYLSASFPADLPYVTAVGSTQFAHGTSGEQVGVTFSGGGFSWTYNGSSFSKSEVGNYFENRTTQLPKAWYADPSVARPTPDVSALGENFLIIIGGQPFQIGGTSASTPSIAGIVTLLNNIRLREGKTLGWVNPLFYSNPQVFVDVVRGSNDQKQVGGGWYASGGWDPVTGLGTPFFPHLRDLVVELNRKDKN